MRNQLHLQRSYTGNWYSGSIASVFLRRRRQRLYHFLGFPNFFHPLKPDLSRMTVGQYKRMVDPETREDRRIPSLFRPIITIGHTKDLLNFKTVEEALGYLEQGGIRIFVFGDIYQRARRPNSKCGTGIA